MPGPATALGEPGWVEVGEQHGGLLPWSQDEWPAGEWSRVGTPPTDHARVEPAAVDGSAPSQRPAGAAPTTRRQLRESRASGRPPSGFESGPVPWRAPAAPWVAGRPEAPATHPGPTTAELERYRTTLADPRPGAVMGGVRSASLELDRAVAGEDPTGFRGGVERWSRWAAGLGLPLRDRYGVRHYPAWERLLPPGVLIAAGLGVAAVVGVLTGILVAQPGAASGTVQTAVATTTVTVTNDTTTTATTTATRTRTQTVTAAPTPQGVAPQPGQTAQPAPIAQGQAAGQALGPGSQGTSVFALQQELAQLGLLQGPPTGTYDGRTQAAVQNFQARAGITADPPGVAGPATIQALNQALGR
ncbi:MAG: peptidoglycan-binding domain-containing protein [Kineosporiaceae bacterium]